MSKTKTCKSKTTRKLDTPCSILYEDVEALITQETIRHWKRYGGDYDELRSQANEIFMRAYRTFDVGKGAFTTWLTFLLRKILLEKVRRQSMRNARIRHHYVEDVEEPTTTEFNMVDFVDELSDDGQTIIHLIFDMPKGLACICEDFKWKPLAIREVISEYLLGLEWEHERITTTFREVTKLLGS